MLYILNFMKSSGFHIKSCGFHHWNHLNQIFQEKLFTCTQCREMVCYLKFHEIQWISCEITGFHVKSLDFMRNPLDFIPNSLN